jgi:2-keto-4-pentenoate hydratase
MTPAATEEAADILWRHWQASTRIDALPERCRPQTRADGYAVQAAVAVRSQQTVAGWKIAATSAAGQRHIAVDGPLAGRLLAGRRVSDAATISLAANGMRAAEAEFAFRMARDLPRRQRPYDVSDVMGAIGDLHPAIEVPDSRYHEFVRAGAAQLIADTACACWFLIGGAVPSLWRDIDLVTHRVTATRNGAPAGDGSGANVLGDPRVALTWIANELIGAGEQLRAGDFVMTGTCLTPVPVAPGDRVEMYFGECGKVSASFS